MPRVLIVTFLILAATSSISAADWPQFLGPHRDNTSSDSVAPWKGKLKTVWKQPVGDAHSSPVVANGVVYAFFQPNGKNADMLAAYDAATGKPLWQKSYDRAEFKPLFGNGPRSTPTVVDGRVYTLGGTGVLACWDAKTGDIVWKIDTLKQFHAKNLFFGISTSPLVIGQCVVIMVGAKGAGIVAFNKANGEVLWKATDDPSSYSSPIATGSTNDQQLIFLTGSHLRSLSPEGKELWSVPFKDKLNESSTSPVKVGDMVIASSVTAGSIGVNLKPVASGDKPHVDWKNEKLTCYFSTPVVVGDYLYMMNGVASLTNASLTLRCVETRSGKVMWDKPNVGKYHAALIRTGNDKLLMLDDNGFLSLIEPSAKAYTERARTKVCGPTWAHPALVGNKVYLRDEKELICVSLAD